MWIYFLPSTFVCREANTAETEVVTRFRTVFVVVFACEVPSAKSSSPDLPSV